MTFTLQEKPLAEALLEIRWALAGGQMGPSSVDPVYPFLVGLLSDRLTDEYPVVERLPAADVPDEFTPYVVKHRLRVGPDQWPVLQVGPGVATLNATSDYDWDDFRARATQLLEQLSVIHDRHGTGLDIEQIVLRYINRFPDPDGDVLAHVRTTLNLGVDLPASLDFRPSTLAVSVESQVDALDSVGAISVAQGAVGDQSGVILDLRIFRRKVGPSDVEACVTWLTGAHSEIEKWFLAFVEGATFERLGGRMR